MKQKKYFIPEPEAVTVFPDGREVCNDNPAGRREYKARTVKKWSRQEGICPLCDYWIELRFAQTDHQTPRGMGGAFTDDRTEIEGEWHNAAVHAICNNRKGSLHYHWENGKYVPNPSRVLAKEVA